MSDTVCASPSGAAAISHGLPFGIPKLRIGSSDVPTFVTVAEAVGARVVVEPTVTDGVIVPVSNPTKVDRLSVIDKTSVPFVTIVAKR